MILSKYRWLPALGTSKVCKLKSTHRELKLLGVLGTLWALAFHFSDGVEICGRIEVGASRATSTVWNRCLHDVILMEWRWRAGRSDPWTLQ